MGRLSALNTIWVLYIFLNLKYIIIKENKKNTHDQMDTHEHENSNKKSIFIAKNRSRASAETLKKAKPLFQMEANIWISTL